MVIKWNFSGKTLSQFQKADVIVLSVGKSGRTWMRVLINKYLSLHCGVPFDLGSLAEHDANIPYIVYTHEIWRHFSDASWKHRLKGKYIIPDRLLFQKKIILLHRDPRDVVVSLYFQKTTRSGKKITCPINEFIRHRKYGINNIVKVLNIWQSRLKDHPACLKVSYEGMKKDIKSELFRILTFIGVENVNEALVDEAVAFSSFDNMKRMEQKGEFNKRILRPADPDNPDSFKVREGKVGGHVCHFSEADITYLNDSIKKLNACYRYSLGI